MLSECMHCHARVVLIGGTRCPACQKNTDDPGATPHLTRTSVMAGERLPAVCAGCAEPTDRKELIEHSEVHGGESAFVRFLLLLAAVVSRHALGAWLGAKGKKEELTVEVRLCETCAATPLRPLSIHPERRTMIFLVHRTFAEALTETRGRRRAEPGAISTPMTDGSLSDV